MLRETKQKRPSKYDLSPYSRKCKIIYPDRRQMAGVLGTGRERGVTKRNRHEGSHEGTGNFGCSKLMCPN